METIRSSNEICKSRLSSVEESKAFARNSGGKLLVTEPDNLDPKKISNVSFEYNSFFRLSREILNFGNDQFKI